MDLRNQGLKGVKIFTGADKVRKLEIYEIRKFSGVKSQTEPQFGKMGIFENFQIFSREL